MLQAEPVKEEAEEAKGSNTMADLQDPHFPATRAGFEVDKLYTRKSDGLIFRLVAMDASIKLQEVGLKKGEKLSVDCSFDDIGKQFGLFKGKLQVKLSPTELPNKSLQLEQDLLRAKVFEQVMDGTAMFAEMENAMIDFLADPSEVRAKIAIDKGQLKLFPTTCMNKLVFTSTTKKIVLYLETPKKPGNVHLVKEAIWSSFWMIKRTTDTESVNMVLTTMKFGSYMFPVYTNSKALAPFDLLAAASATSNPAKKART